MAASELNAWLDAAARIPRITPAQEIMLARQVQAAQALPATGRSAEQERAARRGLRAQQRLTEANLRLVWRIVDKSYRPVVPAHVLPDLLQMGAEGVFHAASKFNPEAGYKFSTYAACWIRERCQKELDKMGRPIRVPTTLTNAARKLPRVQAALLQRLGRPATVAELAAALPLSEVETRLLLQRLQPVASLDQQVCGRDGDCLLGDLVAAPPPPESDPPPSRPPPAAPVGIMALGQLSMVLAPGGSPASRCNRIALEPLVLPRSARRRATRQRLAAG